MKIFPHLASCGFILAVFLSACESNTLSTDTPSTVDTLHRQISATLRATCPAIPASRSLRENTDTALPVVQVRPSPIYSFTYQIFDTTGSFIGGGTSLTTINALAADSISTHPIQFFFAWNAKDMTGNSVPSGHYFLFDVIQDSTGAVVQTDSSCIGILRAASN